MVTKHSKIGDSEVNMAVFEETPGGSANDSLDPPPKGWPGEPLGDLNDTFQNLSEETNLNIHNLTTIINPGHIDNLCLLLFLACFCVATVFGNTLVILAVSRERCLQTATNYFIMSLAVADSLVGAIVMPFSAIRLSMQDMWVFGQDWCDVYNSIDVLASTASILNLCVISLDRYWAITDPFAYPRKMTSRSAYGYIALVWMCSSLISFPAIAWWRADSKPQPYKCVFTDDIKYLVFSSIISFWGPLIVMLFTCYRIYRAAVNQTRCLKLGSKQIQCANGKETEVVLRMHVGGGSRGNGKNRWDRGLAQHKRNYSGASHSDDGGGLNIPDAPNLRRSSGDSNNLDVQRIAIVDLQSSDTEVNSIIGQNANWKAKRGTIFSNFCTKCVGLMRTDGIDTRSSLKVVPKNLRNLSISRKFVKIAKERKAAKTLGIVMGVFIVCWLPFFIVNNLLLPICASCVGENGTVVVVVTWLGWLNSGMNPIIYTFRSADFRRAFCRILCCLCPQASYHMRRPTARWRSATPQTLQFLSTTTSSSPRMIRNAKKHTSTHEIYSV